MLESGMKFGRLTVIEEAFKDNNKNKYIKYYLFRCDCGNEKIIGENPVRYGRTKSCGCLKKETNFKNHFIDITGKRYGKLTVLRLSKKEHHSRNGLVWVCSCDCDPNKEIYIIGNDLKYGNTSSCGCYRREKMTIHGKTHTKIHKIWNSILQRCLNENNEFYEYYGGRGITVCDEWLEFENFYRDMGDPPDGMSIDRINNNKGYYKENCRWATREEQQRNTRRTKLDKFKVKRIREFLLMEEKPSDLAKLFNVSQNVIYQIKDKRTWKNIE